MDLIARALANAAAQATAAIRGDIGKAYRIVAGVIRNNGTGVWEQLTGAHESAGIASVIADTTKITLSMSFTATKVVALLTGADETFAQAGYTFGPSVGTNTIEITCVKEPVVVGGYVYYDGAVWQVAGAAGNLAVAGFNTSTGILTLSHVNVGTNNIFGQATSRDGILIPVMSSCGATTSEVLFKDWSGATQLTPSTNMRFFFERVAARSVVDPTTLNVAGANIWILGVFEV